MKLFLKIAIVLAPVFFYGQESSPSVHFSKNVELTGYIIHLIDPEGNDPEHPISKIINQYPQDRQNETLIQLINIASTMDYAFIIDLCYSLPPFPLAKNYDILAFLNDKYPYKSTDEIATIHQLVALLQGFVKTSGFETIYLQLRDNRIEVIQWMEKHKASSDLLNEMEHFYESSFQHYEIVPSLTIWSSAGWGFKYDENTKATFILGPVEKNYSFIDKEKLKHLTIHEFGHSFVNHHVLAKESLIEETRILFPPLKDAMFTQGYRDWESCMVEHFVRAGEIILPQLVSNSSVDSELLEHYMTTKRFIYLEFIVERLKMYRLEENLAYSEAVTRCLEDLKNMHLK